jgi:diadenosine tetraphosphatase ApaH/serine/threonine PP2A family protein phosphatase
MPKYAILSDIHSYSDAFEAVLQKCSQIGIDHFLFLGDLVGYNADVRRCIDMARELNFLVTVRGNHDDAVIRSDVAAGFNINASIAIEWTRGQLTEADIEFFRSMPYKNNVPGASLSLVHATLDSPETWGYIFDVHHASANFSYQLSQICFCGHSHLPVAFDKVPFSPSGKNVAVIEAWTNNSGCPEADTDFSIQDELTVHLQKGHKYLFNIGSIGQPRNGDPRASFAVYNSSENAVTRYRIPYDIEAAQAKVLEAGLPERLALRLGWGR